MWFCLALLNVRMMFCQPQALELRFRIDRYLLLLYVICTFAWINIQTTYCLPFSSLLYQVNRLDILPCVTLMSLLFFYK